MLGRDDLIAAARKLWGEPTETKPDEYRFGTRGSKSINLNDLTWYDHENNVGGGVVDLCQKAGNGNGRDQQGAAIYYNYRDERSELLFQVVRLPGHKFFQRRPDGPGNWINDLKGVRRVPYRLYELSGADPQQETVFIVEGEKDADNLAALGFLTTTNPGGAGKWRSEYSEFLRDFDVVILPDNDEPGKKHAAMVETLLKGFATSVTTIMLPGLGDKEDVSDWIGRGGTADKLRELVAAATPTQQTATTTNDAPVTAEQFYFHSEENKCIFMPTSVLWPLAAVNARLPWVGGTKPTTLIAAQRPVEQSTWVPGEPRLIRHKLVHQGGWIDHPNATVFNQYRSPKITHGDPVKARIWIDHVHLLYPDEAVHIIQWFAHRVQHPEIKINHALVLGGMQGIGKDTMFAPVAHAVGHWNVQTVSPVQLLEKFNGHLRSVILVVSEARDLGEINRPQFYEHLKLIIAAPPDVLYINEKNRQQYYIPNLTGVVITTNHKAGGIYLSAEDRRHMVAWSNIEMNDFEADYFDRIWEFFLKGGLDDVASYLREVDLTGFDPKRPPPKTPAFWEIVQAGQHSECADIETAITNLGHPTTLTLDDLVSAKAGMDAEAVIEVKRSRKMLARWLEPCGYKAVRNPMQKQGFWWVGGKNCVVFGKSDMLIKDLEREIKKRQADGSQGHFTDFT